jgi:putative ABC transport system substrate-binding protein
VLPVYATAPQDLEPAFAEMKIQRVDAVMVPGSLMMVANAQRLSELSLRYRLPDVHELRSHVEAGSLISYGYDQRDLYRRAASYVHRIIRGATPAELPIEQSRKFELAINLRTAKALGLTIPQSVLVRADHVIQ